MRSPRLRGWFRSYSYRDGSSCRPSATIRARNPHGSAPLPQLVAALYPEQGTEVCSVGAAACMNRGRRCVQTEACISLSYFLNTPPSPVHVHPSPVRHPAHKQSQCSSPSHPTHRYSRVRPSACSYVPMSNAFDFLDALRPQAVFGTQSAVTPDLICEQLMPVDRKQPQSIMQRYVREAFAQMKTTNSRHFPPPNESRNSTLL